MTWPRYAGMALAGWLAGAGCGKAPVPPPAAPPVAPPAPGPLDHAQPKLPTLKLWLGNQELITEMALDNVQRMTGMMYRKDMAENEAMLFVFPFPHQASFFMKNTTVPLSAAYIDSAGQVLEIHDFQPLNEIPVRAASENIQYVLEVRQGWFQRHQVKAGAVVRTERGTLAETFFKRR